MEVTDGWYAVKAEVDDMMNGLLHAGLLCVGDKIITSGAELIGLHDACCPLDVSALTYYESSRYFAQ